MNTVQDIRYAWRMLVKAPGFTAIAVLTLALGIGANTVMFSVLNAVLLQPLPYPHAEQLMQISWTTPGKFQADYLNGRQADFLLQSPGPFESVAVMFPTPGCNLTGTGEPQHVEQEFVSTGFFRTLGVAPSLGRDFIAADATGARAVILSAQAWKRRFGGEPGIVGQTFACNGAPYTVIGVLPQTFRYPFGPELYVAEPITRYLRDNGSNYFVFGRLKSGITAQQADQPLTAAGAQFTNDFPNFTMGAKQARFAVMPLREYYTAADRQALLLLFGAVVLVLAVACANLAGLLLARAGGRSREIAVRLALGAKPGRLLRQFLTETLLLNLIASAVALVFTYWSLEGVNAYAAKNYATAGAIRLDARVLLFTFAVAVLTGLLAGLAPAWQAMRADVQKALKQGERSSLGVGHSITRKLLVSAEIALAVVLLTGSVLLVRSFARLSAVPVGLDPHNLYVATMSLSSPRYAVTDGVARLQRDVLERLRDTPGIAAAATITSYPTHRDLNLSYAFGDCTDGRSIQYRAISASYFATVGTAMLRGRAFAESEPAPVAIVNEALARRCFPQQDALTGQIISGAGSGMKEAPRQIVGVVADARDFGLARPAAPTIYVPQAQVADAITRYQNSIFEWSIEVRTAGTVDVRAAITSALAAADPQQPIIAIQPASQLLERSLASPRLSMELMSAFGSLSLLLTAVGLYGLLSYYVVLRTHEIGIRMALGATRSDVLRLVLREGGWLIGSGSLAGIAGALAASRLVKGIAFGVTGVDPATLGAAVVLLSAVTLFASYVPARRATTVDPMTALRNE